MRWSLFTEAGGYDVTDLGTSTTTTTSKSAILPFFSPSFLPRPVKNLITTLRKRKTGSCSRLSLRGGPGSGECATPHFCFSFFFFLLSSLSLSLSTPSVRLSLFSLVVKLVSWCPPPPPPRHHHNQPRQPHQGGPRNIYWYLRVICCHTRVLVHNLACTGSRTSESVPSACAC